MRLLMIILLQYNLFLSAIRLKKCVIKLLIFFFLFDYIPDWSETQKMCDEAVVNSLAALKLVPDWFITSQILEKFSDSLLANDDVLIFDEYFGKVTFYANQIGILGVDFDKLTLMVIIIYQNDPDTILNVRLLVWRNKLEKRKGFQKR